MRGTHNGQDGSKKEERNVTKVRRKARLESANVFLFDVSDFDQFAEYLRPLQLEGLDENNVHKFHEAMKLLWKDEEHKPYSLRSDKYWRQFKFWTSKSAMALELFFGLGRE